MGTLQWVYIMQDSRQRLSVGISPSTKSAFSLYSNIDRKMLYLRAFTVLFDAVAHKHLLEDLSFQTLEYLCHRNKKTTKVWIDFLKESQHI